MYRTLALRKAAENVPYIYTNPFRAKRHWPPDFSKFSQKQQFRFERTYKRRTKLKWARPKWVKGVKLVQMASITFVLVYGVLFLDWQEDRDRQPFQETRNWFFGLTGNMWSKDRIRPREPDTITKS